MKNETYSIESLVITRCFSDLKILLVSLSNNKPSLFLFCPRQSWSTNGERGAWSTECFVNAVIGVESVFDPAALHVTGAAFFATLEKPVLALTQHFRAFS